MINTYFITVTARASRNFCVTTILENKPSYVTASLRTGSFARELGKREKGGKGEGGRGRKREDEPHRVRRLRYCFLVQQLIS